MIQTPLFHVKGECRVNSESLVVVATTVTKNENIGSLSPRVKPRGLRRSALSRRLAVPSQPLL